MKTTYFRTLLFAILFLFTLQMAGTLVESIYILDLLNTTLDEKALGLLFFFMPLVLLFFKKKPAWLFWLTLGALFLSRGITPYLNTSGRLISAGIGTGTALSLLPLLLNRQSSEDKDNPMLTVSAGLALATAFSVLLRTVSFSIDYSLTEAGSWVGWLLALGLGWLWVRQERTVKSEESPRSFAAGLGLMLILTLLLFAFSAPAVIARWTDGSYALIVSMVSLLSVGYVAAALIRPDWINAVIARKGLLWGGNLLFLLALTGTLLAHRVAFPLTPDSAVVVVTPPSVWQQLPLFLMLLLYPILFINAAVCLRTNHRTARTGAFTAGVLAGIAALVVLVFMVIFTNVWGYVEPVSPFFRNKFWLPFLLLSGGILAAIIPQTPNCYLPEKTNRHKLHPAWSGLLSACFLLTAAFAFWSVRTPAMAEDKTELTVMTYNIQQANDNDGEKSYRQQLARIREINPDILALQESDSARISLNNNDYVRYYASQLGYYAYYGPATVTGTYGTALLSRYPLENVRTAFSFSDTDEIGTSEAEIVVDGRRFTIFNVHPDGSDTAMMTFAETLLSRSQHLDNVIALGDYNLRSNEAAYLMIAAAYHNVPGSEGHIDHIFLSHDLQMMNPVYIPAPQSATDHPFLYATVTWGE